MNTHLPPSVDSAVEPRSSEESGTPVGVRPEISIAVISKDRHEVLVATVQALQVHLTASGWSDTVELVVTDEGDVPRPLPGVIYRFLPRRNLGFGFARNRAVEACRGRIIVFVDDDVRPSGDWLRLLLDPFADPTVVAVAGGVVPDLEGLGPVGAALGLLGFPAGGVPRILAAGPEPVSTKTISTTNCAFRRNAFDAVGGFDEDLVFGSEDSVFFEALASRCGRTLFNGPAFAYHRQRESLKDISRWAVRRGKAYFGRSLLLGREHFAVIGPIRQSVLPNLLVLALIGGGAAYGAGPVVGVAVLLGAFAAWWVTVWRRAAKGLAVSAPWGSQELAMARTALSKRTIGPMVSGVRFLIDLGEALGRLGMGVSYLGNRLFSPPVIFCFRLTREARAADGQSGGSDLNVAEMRRNGAAFTTVSKLVQRVEHVPATLYLRRRMALVVGLAAPADIETIRGLLADAIPVTAAIAPESMGTVLGPLSEFLKEAKSLGAGASFELALGNPLAETPSESHSLDHNAIRAQLAELTARSGHNPSGLFRPPEISPAATAVLGAEVGLEWALSPRPGGAVAKKRNRWNLPWRLLPFSDTLLS